MSVIQNTNESQAAFRKVCRASGYCGRGPQCNWAHSENEVRFVSSESVLKTCKMYRRGKCKKGDNCPYSHSSLPNDSNYNSHTSHPNFKSLIFHNQLNGQQLDCSINPSFQQTQASNVSSIDRNNIGILKQRSFADYNQLPDLPLNDVNFLCNSNEFLDHIPQYNKNDFRTPPVMSNKDNIYNGSYNCHPSPFPHMQSSKQQGGLHMKHKTHVSNQLNQHHHPNETMFSNGTKYSDHLNLIGNSVAGSNTTNGKVMQQQQQQQQHQQSSNEYVLFSPSYLVDCPQQRPLHTSGSKVSISSTNSTVCSSQIAPNQMNSTLLDNNNNNYDNNVTHRKFIIPYGIQTSFPTYATNTFPTYSPPSKHFNVLSEQNDEMTSEMILDSSSMPPSPSSLISLPVKQHNGPHLVLSNRNSDRTSDGSIYSTPMKHLHHQQQQTFTKSSSFTEGSSCMRSPAVYSEYHNNNNNNIFLFDNNNNNHMRALMRNNLSKTYQQESVLDSNSLNPSSFSHATSLGGRAANGYAFPPNY